MSQHLVDDHLEEQRRREAENLHEQRRRKHMAERTAITPDGGQEPAHAELARVGAGAADPAGDQQRLPADVARAVLERRLWDSVPGRIDGPAEARRTAPTMDAPLGTRTIAGGGSVARRSGVSFETRRALSPISLGARMRSAYLA